MMLKHLTSNKRKWWIWIAIALMVCILNLDFTIVNVALPAIVKDMYTSLSNVQWVVNSYLLFSAMFFILGGRLGDNFGKVKIYIIGLLIFVITSFISGTAAHIETIIIGRALQGIGMALFLPMGLIILTSAFPENKQGFVLGLVTTITGVSQSIAPTLGGIIVAHLHWRWIFFINLPLGLLSLLIICYTRPTTEASVQKRPVDYASLSLLIIGIGALIFSFNEMNSWEGNTHLLYSIMLAGFLVLIIFYFKELRNRHPFFEVRLFSIRNFLLPTIIRGLFMFIWVYLLLCIPLYLQNIQNFSAVTTGLILLAMSICIGGLAPFAGRLIDKVGFKLPMISASIFSFIGLSLLIFLGHNFSILSLIFILITFGIATGLLLPSTLHAAMVSVPQTHKGAATGAFYTVANFGAATGIAIGGSILGWLSSHFFNALIQNQFFHFNHTQLDILHRAVDGVLNLYHLPAGNFTPEQLNWLIPAIRTSFLQGFTDVFILMLLLNGLLLVASLNLQSKK